MLIWKVSSTNLTIASVRYRCLLPIQYLRKIGKKSIIIDSSSQLNFENKEEIEAIIFVKTFTIKDLIIAHRAYKENIPVILDVCDNIFHEEYPSNADIHPKYIFQYMAEISSYIVTTGVCLMQTISERVYEKSNICIIEDGLESIEILDSYQSLLQRKRKKKFFSSFVRSKIKSSLAIFKSKVKLLIIKKKEEARIDDFNGETQSLKKRIIWFGNHGNPPNTGMLNILDIKEELIELSRQIDFCLLVVSNNYEKYINYIEPLPFETEYLTWSPVKIYEYINESDVSIAPLTTDYFNICKSANRTLFSLSLGVPVVATKIPSLEPFNECVSFGKWEESIIAYLTDTDLVQMHISKAQKIIQEKYSGEVIASKWLSVIEKVMEQNC